MPIYAYKCDKCGCVFDKILSVKDYDKPLEEKCPSCNTENSVTRLLSANPNIWKCSCPTSPRTKK